MSSATVTLAIVTQYVYSDTFAWSCGCHSVTVGVEICAYLLDVTVDGVKWWVCLSLPKLMILIQNFRAFIGSEHLVI